MTEDDCPASVGVASSACSNPVTPGKEYCVESLLL